MGEVLEPRWQLGCPAGGGRCAQVRAAASSQRQAGSWFGDLWEQGAREDTLAPLHPEPHGILKGSHGGFARRADGQAAPVPGCSL